CSGFNSITVLHSAPATASPNAVREIHGDRADLYVTDTIYKYRSQGFFIIEGRLVPIRFNLKATMP
ncbi:hypothetical protein, partial [Pseudomonas aeruginosa]|uniref:hypothetical protein n=1 Tax=Pseudomonas aeruginosa TaxID=287 RepID=UPI003BF46B13